MHELGICDAILKTVDGIVKEEQLTVVHKVTLEVGMLSGVVPRFMTDCWQAVIDGTWADLGNYYGGIKEGFVDVAPLTDNCVEGTQEKIDAVKELLMDGSWDVFSGVKLSFDESGAVVQTDGALEDSEGNTIVEAGGASVEDKVITGEMNYFVKGVELK